VTITRDKLVEALRLHRAPLVEADEWRPLADHVLELAAHGMLEQEPPDVPASPETTGHSWHSIGDGYLESIWRLRRCLAIMRSNLRAPDSWNEMRLHQKRVAWHAFTATKKQYVNPKNYELVLRPKKRNVR
jgi:hypothetical protein